MNTTAKPEALVPQLRNLLSTPLPTASAVILAQEDPDRHLSPDILELALQSVANKPVIMDLLTQLDAKQYSESDVKQILADYIFDRMNAEEPERVDELFAESELMANNWWAQTKILSNGE